MSAIITSIITSLLQFIISKCVDAYNSRQIEANKLKVVAMNEYIKSIDEARADERKIMEAATKHTLSATSKEITGESVKFNVVTTPEVKGEKGEVVVPMSVKVSTDIKPDSNTSVNFEDWNIGK